MSDFSREFEAWARTVGDAIYDHVGKESEQRHRETLQVHRDGWELVANALRDGLGLIAGAIRDHGRR